MSQLLLAQSYGKLEGTKKVVYELESVFNNNNDPTIRSEAARLIGLTLYEESPRENAPEAMAAFPEYAQVISLFSEKLGSRSSSIERIALLTTDNELIPFMKVLPLSIKKKNIAKNKERRTKYKHKLFNELHKVE